MRLTIACPADLTAMANHLAMALGTGPSDSSTFGAPIAKDANGFLYAAASFEADPSWLIQAQSPKATPLWDTTGMVDLDQARAAATRLRVLQADDRSLSEPVLAAPDQIMAMVGLGGAEALIAAGLTFIDTDEGTD
tara:strand:- start:203 stop:610 length:408 start_codon:yes stop_codon:yes gene_type:complete